MKSLRIFLLATLILVFFGLDNVEASKEPEWSYATDYFASSVAISSDGEYIVAGSDDRNVYFFDKDSSTPLWNYETGDDVDSVAISSDG